ncbi:wall-associated receptor kinase 2-like [Bidens hawaiensis]|uniref:wall-associated receptor kinase 2-like n=1 Tax=Bidens hawaiensis TaxID=980011 RepID=UPI00404A23A7
MVKLAESQVVQSLPGCSDKCGKITIPYPFGIEENCYLDRDYRVNCTTLRLYGNPFTLLDISLDGFMRGAFPVMTYSCYNSTHKRSGSDLQIWLRRFSLSRDKNLLTTVGCDTRADIMTIDGEEYITGGASMSTCNSSYDATCFGYGCRQLPLPYTMSRFLIRSQTNKGKLGNWSFNNCSYAFIVQKDQYTFRHTDFDSMLNRSLPAVLEWAVGTTYCLNSQKNTTSYVCKENSVCITKEYGNGYNCRCASGYQGNPYLPNGCQGNSCTRKLLWSDRIYRPHVVSIGWSIENGPNKSNWWSV